MKKGFTLVELLVVISIIAILAVVISVSFSRAQKDGRDQRRVEDLKAIQNAAEQYYMLNGGSYPVMGNYRSQASSWMINSQVVLQKYPLDPKNIEYLVNNSMTNVSGYCVCAVMENLKNSNAENTSCTFSNVATNQYFCVRNQQ